MTKVRGKKGTLLSNILNLGMCGICSNLSFQVARVGWGDLVFETSLGYTVSSRST